MSYYICYKGKDNKPIIKKISKAVSKEIAQLHFRHLCFGCINACNVDNMCEKVFDIEKQTIYKYDFIEEGFQLLVTDKDFTEESIITPLMLKRFIVTACKNHFEEETYKVTTRYFNSKSEYKNVTEEVSKRLVKKTTCNNN